MPEYLQFPHFDPVLIKIWMLEIRWYALAYLAGIFLGWWYVVKINKQYDYGLSAKALENLPVWITLGIVFGGRIGHVLFYKLDYYLANPLEIPMIWNGGMSFHGGLAGVIIASLLYSRIYKISAFRLFDMLAIVAPIGLFFGRLANFINGELWGRVTTSWIGMIFPDQILPRHPSQLYEAILEGLLLFIVLNLALKNDKIRSKSGIIAGLFLILYGLARSFVELFREPTEEFVVSFITTGQALSIPMIFLGIILIICRR